MGEGRGNAGTVWSLAILERLLFTRRGIGWRQGFEGLAGKFVLIRSLAFRTG